MRNEALYLFGPAVEDRLGPVRMMTSRLQDRNGNDLEEWDFNDPPLKPYEIGTGQDVRHLDRVYLRATKGTKARDLLPWDTIRGGCALSERLFRLVLETGATLDPACEIVPLTLRDRLGVRRLGDYVYLHPMATREIFNRDGSGDFRQVIIDQRPNVEQYNLVVDQSLVPEWDMYRSTFKFFWIVTGRVVQAIESSECTGVYLERLPRPRT